MANPTGKGGFMKGESGNPGGRPKLPNELREMIQAKAPEALEVLVRCLQSPDERIAMIAANSLLDRGYGKPTQSIDANVSNYPSHEEILRQLSDHVTEIDRRRSEERLRGSKN